VRPVKARAVARRHKTGFQRIPADGAVRFGHGASRARAREVGIFPLRRAKVSSARHPFLYNVLPLHEYEKGRPPRSRVLLGGLVIVRLGGKEAGHRSSSKRWTSGRCPPDW
jgi:hypothetical protein